MPTRLKGEHKWVKILKLFLIHTIHMVFNNSGSITVGMNSKKIEKEKQVDCR